MSPKQDEKALKQRVIELIDERRQEEESGTEEEDNMTKTLARRRVVSKCKGVREQRPGGFKSLPSPIVGANIIGTTSKHYPRPDKLGSSTTSPERKEMKRLHPYPSFPQVAFRALIAQAFKWNFAALVVLGQLQGIGRKAAQSIIRFRLCFLVSRFLPAEEFDNFMQLLFATGGALTGDVALRLTQSYDSVFNPEFDDCLTGYCLTIVVSSRKSMLLVVAWLERIGYSVWRGMYVKDGKVTSATNFPVGARTREDLLTGRSVTIAYGDGIGVCSVPCLPSNYINIVTPTRIYRALPPSGDISKDEGAGIQCVRWTQNYKQDSAGFLFYTVRDSLLRATRPHECWNPECTQRTRYFDMLGFRWLDDTDNLKMWLQSVAADDALPPRNGIGLVGMHE
ncbi:hypothetical protein FA13DRAFT_1712675 [Coprinellus micaceus]|uniref:Uncharacterized protein n=1 Tax=Coprinellus micaceus TaxID=71717 RepID=A0A4Y7T196_COPMI|nr:hypothetical protein FA13DRAFT_1712675 [Coprinellus micaceus]